MARSSRHGFDRSTELRDERASYEIPFAVRGAPDTLSVLMKDATDSPVILYDGECGLCDRLVQWVLRRDRSGHFRFAALQSEWGQSVLRNHGLPVSEFDTMALIENNHVYVRSTAALRVLRGLPRWRWAYGFIAVPRWLRDVVYRYISRRRKRWFPPPAVCGVPPPQWRERFID